ncbi:MAG: MoxR family ATPase [Dehalococcoidia bacterium]
MLATNISADSARIQEEAAFVVRIKQAISKAIVGQEEMVDRLLIGLLCRGHILIEGVPGLAKSLAVKSLADAIDVSFTRVQFTPDLLPADLTGTMVFNPKDSDFYVRRGPIFNNLVLADEVNRAPAKVQSALLEAMQERQVSIGGTTYPLEEPFMVLATQNPIEQEGTYPLPEAQLDRFMLKVLVTYPTRLQEKQILELGQTGTMPVVEKVASGDDIRRAREAVNQVHLEESLKDYITEVIFATREPAEYRLGELAPMIAYGASPRATIYMAQAARAHAFINGRSYVLPEDVKIIAPDVLRHRVILTYEAEAEELSSDDLVRRVLDSVAVP